MRKLLLMLIAFSRNPSLIKWKFFKDCLWYKKSVPNTIHGSEPMPWFLGLISIQLHLISIHPIHFSCCSSYHRIDLLEHAASRFTNNTTLEAWMTRQFPTHWWCPAAGWLHEFLDNASYCCRTYDTNMCNLRPTTSTTTGQMTQKGNFEGYNKSLLLCHYYYYFYNLPASWLLLLP